MQAEIEQIVKEGGAAVEAATSTDALAQIEVELFGKRSALSGAQRSVGSLEPDARKEAGRLLQEAKAQLEKLVATQRGDLALAERAALLVSDRLDLTEVIPDQITSPLSRGHLHLVSQARDELEDVFVGMGFEVAEGPEAETDWYNFEALNMPPAHPARGMYDTMYLDIGEPETVLLRTHTSPVQIHLMEEAVRNNTLPIHAVMPGKCFRLDTPDARHLPVFNQIEGLVVDRGITFGDLAGTIQTFTSAYFGQDMQSRLRPAYFPFTEPSAEFEITCAICRGAGCRTCSNIGWLELGGCGMVDPAVFAAVGIDADEWSGFAFGFGIDRLALMRHEIPDLRSFMENDIRFLSQF
jgi:phenylalanyl-tRNA synthetase alpha chain